MGFGIRDAASAQAIAAHADAIVIGSRIIEEIEAGPADQAAQRAGAWLATIRAALDELGSDPHSDGAPSGVPARVGMRV